MQRQQSAGMCKMHYDYPPSVRLKINHEFIRTSDYLALQEGIMRPVFATKSRDTDSFSSAEMGCLAILWIRKDRGEKKFN